MSVCVCVCVCVCERERERERESELLLNAYVVLYIWTELMRRCQECSDNNM